MRYLISAALAAAMATGAASAATHEVKMLNRGEHGVMVFEPAFVEAQPGDTIHFVATDKGHNVQAIDGMLPDGMATFDSTPGQDFDLTVTGEGVYGVKCTPHFAMGMVALIQVGAPANLETARAVQHRGKAASTFDGLFAQVRQ